MAKFKAGELTGMMDALIHPRPSPEEIEREKRAAEKTAALKARGYVTDLPLAFLAACTRCGCVVSTVKEYVDAHDRWHEAVT
jgi:hypothetical protein